MLTSQSRAAVLDFVSENENYRSRFPSLLTTMLVAVPESSDSDGEIKKYYTLNETVNIVISSTAKDEADISVDVKKVFQKVIVFFGAWTAALAKKGTTLYDADAITSIIEKSGFFVRIHQEDRTFDYNSAMGQLDTAIIGSVLSGLSAMGGALKIAQTVVGSMGTELKASITNNENTKKVGHLLFICENLMGMPIVSVSLLNTTAHQSETVTQSNCHTTVQEKLNMTYRQDSFLFVDPTYIDQFTNEFESDPNYQALIDKLAGYILSDGYIF